MSSSFKPEPPADSQCNIPRFSRIFKIHDDNHLGGQRRLKRARVKACQGVMALVPFFLRKTNPENVLVLRIFLRARSLCEMSERGERAHKKLEK